MERRTYIYLATPLFILLSCGTAMESMLGATGALAAASVLSIVAWGVVWMRLYKMQRLRPEFAVLSILPLIIYYIDRYSETHLFADSPSWQNLYALTWVGFIWVAIASMRQGVCDTPARPLGKDPVFLLMMPLTLLYAASTFINYYTVISQPTLHQ